MHLLLLRIITYQIVTKPVVVKVNLTKKLKASLLLFVPKFNKLEPRRSVLSEVADPDDVDWVAGSFFVMDSWNYRAFCYGSFGAVSIVPSVGNMSVDSFGINFVCTRRDVWLSTSSWKIIYFKILDDYFENYHLKLFYWKVFARNLNPSGFWSERYLE